MRDDSCAPAANPKSPSESFPLPSARPGRAGPRGAGGAGPPAGLAQAGAERDQRCLLMRPTLTRGLASVTPSFCLTAARWREAFFVVFNLDSSCCERETWLESTSTKTRADVCHQNIDHDALVAPSRAGDGFYIA